MTTIHAYLAYTHIKPVDLLGMDQNALAESLSFTHYAEMGSEWTKVGTAEIEITLEPYDKIVADTITALRKQQGELVAQATRIDGEIQKLLAITNEVTA